MLNFSHMSRDGWVQLQILKLNKNAVFVIMPELINRTAATMITLVLLTELIM